MVPFLLATGGVRLLLSETFLRWEYQRPGFPLDAYGFTSADRLEYGPIALNYLFNGEAIDFLAEQRLPLDKCWQPAAGADDCASFNAIELRHMTDVKSLVTFVFSLALLCLLIALAHAIVSRGRTAHQRDIRAGLRRGAHLTLALILMSAVLSLTSWDFAFDRFHELLFTAGTWRFPFSDTLIRLYPEQLFMDAALVIAGLCMLGASLILVFVSRLTEPSP